MFVPDMILRPSARIISLLSTRVLRIQVTLVGALSASSTTNMWPNFAAFTCSHTKPDIFRSIACYLLFTKFINWSNLYKQDKRDDKRKKKRLTKGESSYVIIPFWTEGWTVNVWTVVSLRQSKLSLKIKAQSLHIHESLITYSYSTLDSLHHD